MKSFVRGALAIALLGSVAAPAMAADLPSRKEAPVYVAPAPIFSWTGFYVGAEFGGQFGQNTGYLNNNYTGNSFLSTGSYSTSGVVGGGLVGYNYQINQFVLGVEGDLTGSSNQGRHTYNYLASGLDVGFPNASVETQYGFGAGVRGRLGYAIDRTLIYFTGGWAYENINQYYNVYNYTGNWINSKENNGRSGYTLGGGVEYAFNYNWSARVEYRWSDYGKYVSLYNNYLFAAPLSVQQHPTDNAILGALIYHFGAPAPVVAKY
jgi:outer membrane immunogenic protein